MRSERYPHQFEDEHDIELASGWKLPEPSLAIAVIARMQKLWMAARTRSGRRWSRLDSHGTGGRGGEVGLRAG